MRSLPGTLRNAGIRTLLKQAGWEIVPQREGELSYVTSEVYAVEGAKGKAQHGVPTPDGLRQTIGLKKGYSQGGGGSAGRGCLGQPASGLQHQ